MSIFGQLGLTVSASIVIDGIEFITVQELERCSVAVNTEGVEMRALVVVAAVAARRSPLADQSISNYSQPAGMGSTWGIPAPPTSMTLLVNGE